MQGKITGGTEDIVSVVVSGQFRYNSESHTGAVALYYKLYILLNFLDSPNVVFAENIFHTLSTGGLFLGTILPNKPYISTHEHEQPPANARM